MKCRWVAPIVAMVSCAILATTTMPARAAELASQLAQVPWSIVHETWQDGNWELFVTSADGSKTTNLTNTPDAQELYPHVSPDGAKICFVCDEGAGAEKQRNVYVMNIDGSDRHLVARNARQPCWKFDSSAIAYLKGEVSQFTYTDYATKGVAIYDLATGTSRDHPNKDLFHLYNLCWSPDGKWFVATVHAGMGYRHTNLTFEADGLGIRDLKIPGCRPDISPDGKRIAWGASDWELKIGELAISEGLPKVVRSHAVVTSEKPVKIYHVDWSPDGRFVAYSRGPDKKILGLIPEVVGAKARGWDIGIADAGSTNRTVIVTTDGRCNKEPDWIPGRKETR